MLEAIVHNHLKRLLKDEVYHWPHHLTLTRLVARSLRRRDTAFIQLDIANKDFWWPGLLLPLCFGQTSTALVLSAKQRQRLLQIENPRLHEQGFNLPMWEGSTPPSHDQTWLLDPAELIDSFSQGYLQSKVNDSIQSFLPLKVSLQFSQLLSPQPLFLPV